MTEPDSSPDPSNWRAYVMPAVGVLVALALVAALALLVVYTSPSSP